MSHRACFICFCVFVTGGRHPTCARHIASQDLELKRQEEEAIINHEFKANPIPKSTYELRYTKYIAEADSLRQKRVTIRREMLTNMSQSFTRLSAHSMTSKATATKSLRQGSSSRADGTCTGNDGVAPASTATAAATASTGRFRAREVPRSVRENRFDQLRYERTSRREAAKDEARKKLENSSLPPRLAHHERQRRLKTEQGTMAMDHHRVTSLQQQQQQQQSTTRRQLGIVPDFERLQREFEEKLTRSKSSNRGKLTVPQEFILNGRDNAAQQERRLKATERRQKVLQQIELEAMNMRESRWPYLARRGDDHRKKGRDSGGSSSSRPTSAPVRYHETRSSLSRRELVLEKIRNGAYDARDVREEKEAMRRYEECHERATAWMKAQSMAASSVQPTVPQAKASGLLPTYMERGPRMHAAARHKQIEEGVRNLVETTLLEHDIYREHKRFVVDLEEDAGDDAYEEGAKDRELVVDSAQLHRLETSSALAEEQDSHGDVRSTSAVAGEDVRMHTSVYDLDTCEAGGGVEADAEANYAEANSLAGVFKYED